MTKSHRLGRTVGPLTLSLALLVGAASGWQASKDTTIHREFTVSKHVSVEVKNPGGRVLIYSTNEQEQRASVDVTSPTGLAIGPRDIVIHGGSDRISVDVTEAASRNRLDITVRVPARANIKVNTNSGAIDVLGNPAAVDASSDTGTIHADVPLGSVKLNWQWQQSKPRFLSDPELPKVKEKAGGLFVINGYVGDKNAKSDDRVELNFITLRGIMLLNIDPKMVPTDLRERQLTNAARAIVRNGDSGLREAVRTVAPKLFADYARTLPPPRETPSLVQRTAPGAVATLVGASLARVNASVTDANGRSIKDLTLKDFIVWENGTQRNVKGVVRTAEPFNLVLLLDVSGSVGERIDLVRKAARNFLQTASPQDRIAVISFREDVQVVSNFSTDRKYISTQLDKMEAGGATAYYDALAYSLVETLRPLHGERTAIVILSDGDDNRSFVPFEALMDAIMESGALLYPLYLPSDLLPETSSNRSGASSDPLRTRYLKPTTRADAEGKRLAQTSGGVYYPIRKLEDIQQAYDDVVTQLRTVYTITYSTDLGLGSTRHVKVRATRDGSAVRLSPAVTVGATQPADAIRRGQQ